MHTLIVAGGGCAALLACLLLGHAWGNGMQGLLAGARIFMPLWLLGAFVNMWIGEQHGYSWGEEFPVFLLVFAIPAVLAGIVWWKFS